MNPSAYQAKRLAQLGIQTWYLRDRMPHEPLIEEENAELVHFASLQSRSAMIGLYVLADYHAEQFKEDMQLLVKLIQAVFQVEAEMSCVLANALKRSELEGNILLAFGPQTYQRLMTLSFSQCLIFRLPALNEIRNNSQVKRHAWLMLQDAVHYWQ